MMKPFLPFTHSCNIHLGRVRRMSAQKAIVEMELASALPGRLQFIVLSAVQTVEAIESLAGMNVQWLL